VEVEAIEAIRRWRLRVEAGGAPARTRSPLDACSCGRDVDRCRLAARAIHPLHRARPGR